MDLLKSVYNVLSAHSMSQTGHGLSSDIFLLWQFLNINNIRCYKVIYNKTNDEKVMEKM